MSVGVMKDYNLKLRNLRASHTLGWSRTHWVVQGLQQHSFFFSRVNLFGARFKFLTVLPSRFLISHQVQNLMGVQYEHNADEVTTQRR